MELPYEKRFHFQDGTAAKSLDELGKKIEGMSYAEFYRHVSGEKNDFANWIRHVLRDPQLADDLQAVTSIVETVEILNDYLHPRGGGLQGRIEHEVLHLGLPAPLTDDEEIVEPPTIEEITLAPLDTIEETGEDVREEIPREWPQAESSAIEGHAPAAPASVAQEWPGLHADVGRMIVKDFILGMLLGILIGFLLGRVFILP